ncbi:MAG: acyltransferase [Treponema sp.]|jgi:peptidoglycan/LPS O-acetylase OafA/YrhL|nr:acyltransferase [Treponema sp.]
MMSNRADGRRPEIKPLTSLRFVFAILVFLCHYSTDSTGEKVIFLEGIIGVEFFFMLSGFILSYTYGNRIAEKKTSLGEFFLARFARIYPLHLATFLLSLALLIRNSLAAGDAVALSWLRMFFNITLLQSFIPDSSYNLSFNIVSWSISDEMFFYLMFPLLLRVFNGRGIKIKAAAGLVALAAYFTAIFLLPGQYVLTVFYINPLVRILEFIWGMLMFRIWRRITSGAENRESAVHRKFLPSVTEIAPVCLLVIMVMAADRISPVYRIGSYYWIPMALLVLGFAQPFGEGIISKLLSLKPFVFLGKISFGFYMLHSIMLSPVPAAVKRVFHLDLESVHPAARFTIIFAAVLAASIASFYCFELPAGNFIKNLSRRWKKPAGTSPRKAA